MEFFTKEARNEFVELVRKDALICHGQIAVGRAQIPKYQREADQPLRCAIAGSHNSQASLGNELSMAQQRMDPQHANSRT